MTFDQKIASDPDICVWVSASAGTGKTKVLTDRVLRLLLNGSAPSKILCITYTNAASAEMEERIYHQLGKWAIAEDDELKDAITKLTGRMPNEKTLKLAKQLFAIVLDSSERIRIQTIHGFCQSVLRRFPLEAEVAPHFQLIDEYSKKELLELAVSKLLSDNNPETIEIIREFATLISETTLNNLLKNIIADFHKFSSLQPTVINRIYDRFGFNNSCLLEDVINEFFDYTVDEVLQLKAACNALIKEPSNYNDKTFAGLSKWLENIGKNPEDYILTFLTQKNEPRKTICTKPTEKILPNIKDILLKEQQRVFAFSKKYQSFKVLQTTILAIKLAENLLRIYRHLKDVRGFLDYDDLILKTINLLEAKEATAWVLYKLDGGIDHLLIDEAQDTSPKQWQLVDALTNEFFAGTGASNKNRSLFVVGDGKQSIYSFQGADPQNFDIMQGKIRKKILASELQFRNVSLALSFRSTEPILQAVDDVFALPQAREGLIFSESDISHAAHRKNMAGRVELWQLLETPVKEKPPTWYIAEDGIIEQNVETICAKQIADEISNWLLTKRKLPSQDREIQPSDIIILVQRRGKFANAMLRELKLKNIPVAGSDRLIVNEHIAVQDCIALAEFLLLPQDDLTLATILKSPFCGLSENDLFELAYDRKEQKLWQIVKNSRFEEAKKFLSQMLNKTDYLTPYELFAYALETLGGRKKMAERLGSEIYDPLNEFLQLAIKYSSIHTPSLQGFVHWFKSGNSEIKRDMEKAGSEVRIMTIHGAKGLQAPIVFLPDTTRMPKSDSGILWEEDLPIWTNTSENDDINCKNIKENLGYKRECEYRRLLYVAMTRAEDELYICGWKTRIYSEKCWYELIKQAAQPKWQEVDGKFIIHSQQTAPAKTKFIKNNDRIKIELPEWVREKATNEPAPSKPLSPSRIDTPTKTLSPVKEQKARLRGLLIHKLLQYKSWSLANNNIFSNEEQNAIVKEVKNIVENPEFAEIFGENSVAEAPISGIVYDDENNPIVISGQIDRIAVLEKDVYIIDYKTNAQVPENKTQIPAGYIKQIYAYRKLVEQIYPDKKIHCGLLFTNAPKLMFV